MACRTDPSRQTRYMPLRSEKRLPHVLQLSRLSALRAFPSLVAQRRAKKSSTTTTTWIIARSSTAGLLSATLLPCSVPESWARYSQEAETRAKSVDAKSPMLSPLWFSMELCGSVYRASIWCLALTCEAARRPRMTWHIRSTVDRSV